MDSQREKARRYHHGLRLDTPAPRVQDVRKYDSRAKMRQEIRRIPLGLPATAYLED